MSNDPIEFNPDRTEPRGEFPKHFDGNREQKLLSADEAKKAARMRLEKWRKAKGYGRRN